MYRLALAVVLLLLPSVVMSAIAADMGRRKARAKVRIVRNNGWSALFKWSSINVSA